MAQFVDIDTAKEFMKETLSKVDIGELHAIREDLVRKSQVFRELLGAESSVPLKDPEMRRLLRMVFATRRRTAEILADYPAAELSEWIGELLNGEGALGDRINNFCGRLSKLPVHLRYDLAGELLHFTNPEKYWLWTRWVWDPRTKTGALPLVLTDDFDLTAESEGESYLKVGQVITFLNHVGRAAEVEIFDESAFGVDTYLSCVYVVYVYTVLRLRMTQEFNKVMPGLPEFSRRLLGVYRMEELKNAS